MIGTGETVLTFDIQCMLVCSSCATQQLFCTLCKQCDGVNSVRIACFYPACTTPHQQHVNATKQQSLRCLEIQMHPIAMLPCQRRRAKTMSANTQKALRLSLCLRVVYLHPSYPSMFTPVPCRRVVLRTSTPGMRNNDTHDILRDTVHHGTTRK